MFLPGLHVAVLFFSTLFTVGSGDEVSADLCKLPDGVFPDPDSCTGFIRCRNGEPEQEFCSEKLLFNPSKLTCDFSNTGNCSESHDFEVSAKVEVNDVACSEEGSNIYPIQSSCTEYYICENRTAYKVKCPESLLMNTKKLTCDYPENVDCDVDSSTGESTVGVKAIYENDDKEESEAEISDLFMSTNKNSAPSDETTLKIQTDTDTNGKEIIEHNSNNSGQHLTTLNVNESSATDNDSINVHKTSTAIDDNIKENLDLRDTTQPKEDGDISPKSTSTRTEFNKTETTTTLGSITTPDDMENITEAIISLVSDKGRANYDEPTQENTSDIKTSDTVTSDLVSNSFQDYISNEDSVSNLEDATTFQTHDTVINRNDSGSDANIVDIFTTRTSTISQEFTPETVPTNASINDPSVFNTTISSYEYNLSPNSSSEEETMSSYDSTVTLDSDTNTKFSSDLTGNLSSTGTTKSETYLPLSTELINQNILTRENGENLASSVGAKVMSTDSNDNVANSISSNSTDESTFKVSSNIYTTVMETDSKVTPGRTLSTTQALMSSDPLTDNQTVKLTTSSYYERVNATSKYLIDTTMTIMEDDFLDTEENETNKNEINLTDKQSSFTNEFPPSSESWQKSDLTSSSNIITEVINAETITSSENLTSKNFVSDNFISSENALSKQSENVYETDPTTKYITLKPHPVNSNETLDSLIFDSTVTNEKLDKNETSMETFEKYASPVPTHTSNYSNDEAFLTTEKQLEETKLFDLTSGTQNLVHTPSVSNLVSSNFTESSIKAENNTVSETASEVMSENLLNSTETSGKESLFSVTTSDLVDSNASDLSFNKSETQEPKEMTEKDILSENVTKMDQTYIDISSLSNSLNSNAFVTVSTTDLSSTDNSTGLLDNTLTSQNISRNNTITETTGFPNNIHSSTLSEVFFKNLTDTHNLITKSEESLEYSSEITTVSNLAELTTQVSEIASGQTDETVSASKVSDPENTESISNENTQTNSSVEIINTTTYDSLDKSTITNEIPDISNESSAETLHSSQIQTYTPKGTDNFESEYERIQSVTEQATTVTLTEITDIQTEKYKSTISEDKTFESSTSGVSTDISSNTSTNTDVTTPEVSKTNSVENTLKDTPSSFQDTDTSSEKYTLTSTLLYTTTFEPVTSSYTKGHKTTISKDELSTEKFTSTQSSGLTNPESAIKTTFDFVTNSKDETTGISSTINLRTSSVDPQNVSEVNYTDLYEEKSTEMDSSVSIKTLPSKLQSSTIKTLDSFSTEIEDMTTNYNSTSVLDTNLTDDKIITKMVDDENSYSDIFSSVDSSYSNDSLTSTFPVSKQSDTDSEAPLQVATSEKAFDLNNSTDMTFLDTSLKDGSTLLNNITEIENLQSETSGATKTQSSTISSTESYSPDTKYETDNHFEHMTRTEETSLNNDTEFISTVLEDVSETKFTGPKLEENTLSTQTNIEVRSRITTNVEINTKPIYNQTVTADPSASEKISTDSSFITQSIFETSDNTTPIKTTLYDDTLKPETTPEKHSFPDNLVNRTDTLDENTLSTIKVISKMTSYTTEIPQSNNKDISLNTDSTITTGKSLSENTEVKDEHVSSDTSVTQTAIKTKSPKETSDNDFQTMSTTETTITFFNDTIENTESSTDSSNVSITSKNLDENVEETKYPSTTNTPEVLHTETSYSSLNTVTESKYPRITSTNVPSEKVTTMNLLPGDLINQTDTLEENTSLSTKNLTFESSSDINEVSQNLITDTSPNSLEFSTSFNKLDLKTKGTTETIFPFVSESTDMSTEFKEGNISTTENVMEFTVKNETESIDSINKVQSTTTLTNNWHTDISIESTDYTHVDIFSRTVVTDTIRDFPTTPITYNSNNDQTQESINTDSTIITRISLPENTEINNENMSSTDTSVTEITMMKTISPKETSDDGLQDTSTTEIDSVSFNDSRETTISNTDYSNVSITSRNLDEDVVEENKYSSTPNIPAALHTETINSSLNTVTETKPARLTLTDVTLEKATTLNTICLTSEGNFPYPNDCNKFYQCKKGVPEISSCVGDEHFDPERKFCTDPCSAKCDPNADCGTTETKTNTEESTSQTTISKAIYSSTSAPYVTETKERTTTEYLTETTTPNKMKPTTEEIFTSTTDSVSHFTTLKSTTENLIGSTTLHTLSSTITSNVTKESTDAVSEEYRNFTEKRTTSLDLISTSSDVPITSTMVTDEITLTEAQTTEISTIKTTTEQEYEMSSANTELTTDTVTTTITTDGDISSTDASTITTKCENKDCSLSKVPTSATLVPFKLCHRKDFLSRPNCNEYLDCTGNVPNKMECPPGLYFNPTTRVCDWPYKAECGTLPKPLFQPTDSFKCPCQSCLIPSTSSCSHYYLCLGFTAYEMKCSSNLYFDRTRNTCNYAPLVECNDYTSSSTTTEIEYTERSTETSTDYSTSTTSTVSTTSASFVCPKHEGLFRHPRNCGMFYQCANWYPYEFNCPPSTHFSESTERCEFPCDAKCDLSLDCGRPSAPPSDPRCSCLNCRLPSPESCTKYIVCTNGKARVEYCPWGKTFDAKRTMCDWAHKVSCHHSAMCPERNGIFPYKNDCRKFVHCSNGIHHVKECNYVLEFDPVKKRCEWPSGRCNYLPIGKELAVSKGKEERKGWKCPKTFGFFSDKRCNMFYHCSFGTPSLKECSKGLLYNPRFQTCDWENKVRCNANRHQKPRRCRVYDRHHVCSDDRKPLPHTLCNMYYDCTAGRACAKQCPIGLYFNNMTGICDLPENVKCLKSGNEEYSLKELSMKCASGEHGRLANPTKNACYYHCRQGKVVSGCCSKGHVYNLHKDKCERRTKSLRI